MEPAAPAVEAPLVEWDGDDVERRLRRGDTPEQCINSIQRRKDIKGDAKHLPQYVGKLCALLGKRHDAVAKVKAALRATYDFDEKALEQLRIDVATPAAKTETCVSIAIYFNKGGVGKSTTCANLAAALAKLGYRVGIVDADVQGSTTGFLQGASEMLKEGAPRVAEEPQGENEAESDVHEVESFAEVQLPDRPTKFPDLNAEFSDIPMLHEKLGQVTGNFQQGLEGNEDDGLGNLSDVTNQFYEMKEISFPNFEPIYLLGSNSALADIGDAFTKKLAAIHEDFEKNSGRGVGAFRVLLQRLAQHNGGKLDPATGKREGLDVILVDVGPTSGLFNNLIVSSCDYILPPCFGDKSSALQVREFLKKSVDGVGGKGAIGTLQRFRTKQAEWVKSCMHTDPAFYRGDAYFFNPLTRVLPIVVTNVQTSSKKPDSVTKDSATWIYAIQSWLQKRFADERLATRSYITPLCDEAYEFLTVDLPQGGEGCRLWPLMTTLRSELPKSQECCTPLPFLHQSQAGSQIMKRVKKVNKVYRELALYVKRTVGLDPQRAEPTRPWASAESYDDIEKKTPRQTLTPADVPVFLRDLYDAACETIRMNDASTMREPELTNHCARNLGLRLATKHRDAGYSFSACPGVWHQEPDPKSRITPDIILTNCFCKKTDINLRFSDDETVIVEAKKEDGKAFKSSCNYLGHLDQVSQQMRQHKSNYGVLFNFDFGKREIQLFYCSRYLSTHDSGSEWRADRPTDWFRVEFKPDNQAAAPPPKKSTPC